MLRKSLFFFQQNATNLVSGDGGRKGLEQLIPQLQVFMETFFSEEITILVVIYCNGELVYLNYPQEQLQVNFVQQTHLLQVTHYCQILKYKNINGEIIHLIPKNIKRGQI